MLPRGALFSDSLELDASVCPEELPVRDDFSSISMFTVSVVFECALDKRGAVASSGVVVVGEVVV